MTGYLGLGSNLGDSLARLRAVPPALERREVAVSGSSSVYETAPQGEVTEQPDFLNACLRVETESEPEHLFDLCKAIERELGRQPGVRHGPRPIDIDLLLLGTLEYRSERLTLPHPELLSRRFVLEPLLELEPGLTLPDGTPLAAALGRVKDQRVRPIGPL